jgi:predicted kinase
VGKSTYARSLATKTGAVLLDIDTCTERLARVALGAAGLDPNDRDSPAYKALLRDPIYEALFDIAEENLGHQSCVIVGPFTTERRDPNWPLRLERRLGRAAHIVYVHCSEATRRQRIEARENLRDQQKLADWEGYASLGRDTSPPPFPHEAVDTGGSNY